ncbi:hypothetical protein VSWAT3_03516 [Vibrionales bacterium SWAT-3]|nr:hypothetical protein VSWAT3_03516 [Vibrionales bacterium SWAT-3]
MDEALIDQLNLKTKSQLNKLALYDGVRVIVG